MNESQRSLKNSLPFFYSARVILTSHFPPVSWVPSRSEEQVLWVEQFLEESLQVVKKKITCTIYQIMVVAIQFTSHSSSFAGLV